MKTIHIGNKVRVSDSCYDTDVWCAGVIDNVLSGDYVADILKDEDNIRPIKLFIKHEDYPNVRPNEELDICVGVDSGLAGIFDEDYYQTLNHDEELPYDNSYYDEIRNPNYKEIDGPVEALKMRRAGNLEFVPYYDCATVEGKGAVSLTEYGDGIYLCRVGRNSAGFVVAIEIDFRNNHD